MLEEILNHKARGEPKSRKKIVGEQAETEKQQEQHPSFNFLLEPFSQEAVNNLPVTDTCRSSTYPST